MITRSQRQVKGEQLQIRIIRIFSLTTSTNKNSVGEGGKQSNEDSIEFVQGAWDVYREYEQQQLQSIKLLTEEEMLNIDQWLSSLYQMYEELRYPMSHRIWQTISYLQDEERLWYEQEKHEIKNDWDCFCKKFEQHIHDRLKVNMNVPSKGHHSSSANEMTQVQQLSSRTSSLVEINSSLIANLSLTMAREIIKPPTHFRGSKDDVIDWLDKLEQRFKMANWNDELKLQYISVHLQEDAYRWWIQSSAQITS